MFIMRKALLLLCALCAAATMSACSAASSEQRVGRAQGYGGPLTVSVTTKAGKITDVSVISHAETPGVGTRAIDVLPDRIVAQGAWTVETVSGATVTSRAILDAVAAAMGQPVDPATATDQSEAPAPAETARSGFGMSASGRIGPGQDAQGNPVYSFNVVFAHGTFDDQGRIVSVAVDQLEVASPNISDEAAPRFGGWPGQREPSGEAEDEDAFLTEVAAWVSKRGRGEDYAMSAGAWRDQMDAYQTMMQGKTVGEVEAWFGELFSDVTGRPLRPDSGEAEDQKKYEALTDAQRAALADVTSSATMSLEDVHGGILTALRRAWEDAQR